MNNRFWRLSRKHQTMRGVLVDWMKCKRVLLESYERWQVILPKWQGKNENMHVLMIPISHTIIIDEPKGPEDKPKKKFSSDKGHGTPVFTKKENATLAQCIEILDWYHANCKNQTKTAKHFDPIYLILRIKQPLVSAWVHKEAKW